MSNIYDKFYTSSHVVKDCISSFQNCIDVGDEEYVVECSAGNGSFLNHLSSYNVKAYDIAPEADGIVQQDFLSLDEDKEYGNHYVHYVSNVPFGRGSSLANKFIKKCTNDHRTKSFSFVLPASHSRSYLMNKVDKYFHLKHQHFCSDFVEYGKSQKINRKYTSKSDPILPDDINIAVLVNQGSASASEIIAGALQDLDRGIVIGRSTFGKGLVQTVFNIDRDRAIKVTTAKYYIPSGRCIQALDYSNRNDDR